MKTTLRTSVLVSAALAIACVAPLHAANAKATGASANGGTPSFAMKACRGGMAEVQLGQMAADKAADPDVKSFAQRMVTDHTKANDELKQLASTKGWTLPNEIDAKHRATLNRLQKLSGPTFDRQYMIAMVSDHNNDVTEFRNYAKSGSDADLQKWAANTLPTLEEHQKMAKETAAKLGRAAKK